MKKHWTQTAAGKKRLSEAIKRSWELRKFNAIPLPPMEPVIHGSRPAPNINGLLGRINHASTVDELKEIEHVLNLRDKLIARLP